MATHYDLELQIDYLGFNYLTCDIVYPFGSFLCMIGNINVDSINTYLLSTIQEFVNVNKYKELYSIPYKTLISLHDKLFNELTYLTNNFYISEIISGEILNKLSNFSYIPDTNSILFPNYIYLKDLKDICISLIEQNYSVLNTDDFNVLSGDNITIRFNYSGNKEPELIYKISQLSDFVAFDASNYVKSKYTIKKCENCGKYFIPISRSDEIYCDNIFDNETGKTCKEIGYEIKLSKDAYRTAYRTAYKTQRARIKYNSHISDYEQKHFKPWDIAAKEALNNFQSKDDIEGFKDWLKTNKDNF